MAIRFGDTGAHTWLSGSDEGNLSIVGAITSSVVVEHAYQVSGAISTALGVTASAGVTASYGHYNNLAINDGGTKSIRLQPNGQLIMGGGGVLTIAGGAAGTTCLSASGDVNVVGNLFIEGSLNSTGAFAPSSLSSSGDLNIVGNSFMEGTLHVTGAVSGAVGVSGVSISANNKAVMLASGEISGSGPLNIVGASTLESTLSVTGAITTAAGLTASAGVSSSYAFVNNIGVNDGGTKSIRLQADGTSLFGGKMTVSDEISGSGVLNIVGAATLESTLNVTGAITTAAGLTASAGVSSSYGFYNNLAINDGGTKSIRLQADGQLIMGGAGVLTIAGGAAGTTCLSASGDVNVVGNLFIEGSLNSSGAFAPSSLSSSGDLNIVGNSFVEGTSNVTGAISTAAGVTASLGVSASYGNFNSLGINDGGTNSVIVTGDGIVNASQRVTSALGLTGSSLLVNGKIHLNANANIGGVASLSASLGVTGSSVRVNDTIHLNANGNITSVHHIYPATDNTYDLGAAGNRWRNIYTGDLHLSNETRGGGNEVDGTWGSYIIQEGESDLFLINKRTGQRFRFVTEEVE